MKEWRVEAIFLTLEEEEDSKEKIEERGDIESKLNLRNDLNFIFASYLYIYHLFTLN